MLFHFSYLILRFMELKIYLKHDPLLQNYNQKSVRDVTKYTKYVFTILGYFYVTWVFPFSL